MQKASHGTQEITKDISDIATLTSQADEFSTQALQSSKMMANQSKRLHNTIATFVEEINKL